MFNFSVFLLFFLNNKNGAGHLICLARSSRLQTAMISIEAEEPEEARKLFVDKIIDVFAEKKTRCEKFKM